MGDIDIRVKNFIKINSVFAQLFSKGLYNGSIWIDPDQLEEFDTVSQDTLRLADGQAKSFERLRDTQKLAMVFEGKVAFQVIMGIEGQTGVHYYMPVRCMELDALSYSGQCRKISEKAKEDKKLKKYADGVPKGTKIIPIVTLVFYYGNTPWDGPVSVYDMLEIPDDSKEYMKNVVPNYKMNLIDARHMTDDEVDKFDGDLKAFLLMLRGNYDRERLKATVAMHRETWYAISAIKNDHRYMEYIDSVSDEEIAGGVNMDATLDFIEARGRAEGKAEGREDGINKVNRLALFLSRDGRIDDFVRSASDQEFQKQLFQEYGLEDS